MSTIAMLYEVDQTISEFNRVITNVEDNSQAKLIDSLKLEMMQIGAELDSMYLRHDK
mgnify:FL=1